MSGAKQDVLKNRVNNLSEVVKKKRKVLLRYESILKLMNSALDIEASSASLAKEVGYERFLLHEVLSGAKVSDAEKSMAGAAEALHNVLCEVFSKVAEKGSVFISLKYGISELVKAAREELDSMIKQESELIALLKKEERKKNPEQESRPSA